MAVWQRTLFGDGDPHVDDRARFDRIELDDTSWIDVSREWLLGADALLDALLDRVDWKQGRRRMYDRMVDDPRLSRWYRREDPMPHPALDAIGARLEARLGVRCSGPACNYYRDGNDSVACHADRELRELTDTRVAIVTLGARRPFLIRPKGGGRSRNLAPGSGDLLVMGGACQMRWEHAVPKTTGSGPRVSCSWRWSQAQIPEAGQSSSVARAAEAGGSQPSSYSQAQIPRPGQSSSVARVVEGRRVAAE